MDLDLVDVSLDTSTLLGPIGTQLGPLADTVTADATVGQLQVYADVARGSGVIQSVNAVTNAVTLQATPSVADLYVGTIADAVFFNRTHTIDPAVDLTPATVGSWTSSCNSAQACSSTPAATWGWKPAVVRRPWRRANSMPARVEGRSKPGTRMRSTPAA